MRCSGATVLLQRMRGTERFCRSRDKPQVEARGDCCAGWPCCSLSAREDEAFATGRANRDQRRRIESSHFYSLHFNITTGINNTRTS